MKRKVITYVGTPKKEKIEIPPEFLPYKNREVNSCLFGFNKDITILSYVSKKSKAVLAISIMHHLITTDADSVKPEIIEYYNQTKGGVVTLDHMHGC